MLALVMSLLQSLKLRANTPITLIKKRLKRLDLELEYKENFQHHYINYDLEETTNEIEQTIKEQLNKWLLHYLLVD